MDHGESGHDGALRACRLSLAEEMTRVGQSVAARLALLGMKHCQVRSPGFGRPCPRRTVGPLKDSAVLALW